MKRTKIINLFDDVPSDIIIKEKKSTKEGIIAKKFLEEYYIPRYEELFGIPPIISWGKDLKLIIRIIKTYKDISIFGIETYHDLLIRVCEKYFISKDALALKNAWNIGIFYTNFQKLAFLLKNTEGLIIQEIIEGYKLAYLNYIGNKNTESFINKDEAFSQIYIFLKPLWEQYGESFSLKRFSEIFFLILFEHMKNKECDITFFTTKYAIDYFTKWLTTEGKEILMFFPKEVGYMTKEQLAIEEAKMRMEERALVNR